jgi:putative Holliday junction resolvase
MRALGIDFGEKRIGLAISDPDGSWAMPLTTLERGTDRRAVHAIANIVRREGVGRLVLGEPRAVDGSLGPAVERVRRFGTKLAKATGLPLVLVTETLTTVEAEQRLQTSTKGRASKGAPIDAIAAQIILQEALDEGPEPLNQQPRDPPLETMT